MTNWISVKDHLPDDGQKVRIWAGGEHIATFRKGISKEDRIRMKSRERVPYNWEGDGCMAWKGQEVTHWAQTSEPPAEEEHGMKCTGMNCTMQYPYDVSKCTAVESCRQRTLPITNADKIRAMSDEELAEFLSVGVVGVFVCDFCEIVGTPREECNVDNCRKASLKWLQQQAKEDEEEDHGNQTDI